MKNKNNLPEKIDWNKVMKIKVEILNSSKNHVKEMNKKWKRELNRKKLIP